MKFLDYEKIIREKYPILIESYVKQYGEEYRGHITNVLEKVEFCIYETPVTISEYINRKIDEDFIKAVLDSYNELGVDISSIRIDEEGLVFLDDSIGEFTKILFPALDNFEVLKHRGIFTFSDEFDSLDISDPIIKERFDVLEKLKYKSSSVSCLDFIFSGDYDNSLKKMKEILKIVRKNIDKHCSFDYDSYLDYSDQLEEKVNKIAEYYEKEFLISIKDHLCIEDQEKLEESDFDIRDLKDYCLYFDSDIEKQGFTFSDGILYYFLDDYTEELEDDTVDKDEKRDIVNQRLKYLKKIGYDISFLDGIDLFCDWYQIDCLKDYLPDCDVLENRDSFECKYEYEAAKACIINKYDLFFEDSEVSTIVDSTGHSCSFKVRDNFDADNPIPVICISPLNDTYNLFDISLDHELRHAIEMRIEKKDDKYKAKIGTDITIFDDNLKQLESSINTNYNERVTQKLSVEACKDRWLRGEFIFSDKYALITDYFVSCYDYDIDKLNIIFEPLRDKLMKAQISDDFFEIYKVIPEEYMLKIDKIIGEQSDDVIPRLNEIRDRLLSINRRNVKVKNKK